MASWGVCFGSGNGAERGMKVGIASMLCTMCPIATATSSCECPEPASWLADTATATLSYKPYLIRYGYLLIRLSCIF